MCILLHFVANHILFSTAVMIIITAGVTTVVSAAEAVSVTEENKNNYKNNPYPVITAVVTSVK